MDELVEIERAGWDSLCDGNAASFYRRTMTEDGVMVLADGSVMSRDDVVAALGEARPWTSYEIDEVRAVPVGRDSTALVYRAVARRGDSPPFVGMMTSVYVRRGGAWRLAVFQQTPVPEAA